MNDKELYKSGDGGHSQRSQIVHKHIASLPIPVRSRTPFVAQNQANNINKIEANRIWKLPDK